MNYIYDILLNFKDEFYDFYDWNNNDNIQHIRKIPIFKIESDDLINIKNNKIKLDISFLEKIENKTELFTNKGVKRIRYSCLFSDGESVIGINYINKKLKISSLLIDEEMDALEDIISMDNEEIRYKIEKINNSNELKTRKQLEIENYLKKELFKIKDDLEKLEYLYYECFNEKEHNKDKIMIKFNKFNDENVINKLYDFFKIIKVHK